MVNNNAADWSASVRKNAWTVVFDAGVRSIVAFAPGAQGADATYGYVGWVDNAEFGADGRWISVTGMNAAGGEWV